LIVVVNNKNDTENVFGDFNQQMQIKVEKLFIIGICQ